MVNEIYVGGELVLNENPKKQFKKGYQILCIKCNKLIERKWYEKKILECKYECKHCVLTHNNPMFNPIVKEKHNNIVNSKEYRENMSFLMKGEKNGFYGKKHSKDTIDLIRIKNEKYRNSLTESEKKIISKKASLMQKKLFSDNPEEYSRKRSKAAKFSHISQFRNWKMNKVESKVFNYLKENGVDVVFSVILHKYQFDLGVKEKRILIEVDGDYWHGNPKFYNEDGSDNKRILNETQKEKIKVDSEKTLWAFSRNFTLIRLWEDEVNDGTFKEKLNICL